MDKKEDTAIVDQNIIYQRITDKQLIDNTIMVFCSICYEFMKDPCSLTCGHLFCLTCIKSTHNKSCPKCNHKNAISKSSLKESLEIKNMMSNIEIMCPNDKCKAVFKIKDLKEHLIVCDYEKEKCLYCPESFERIDLKPHEVECGQIPYHCKSCKKDFLKNEKHEKECPHMMIDCKYKCDLGCSIRLPNRMMIMHEEDLKHHLDIAMSKLKDNKYKAGILLDILDCGNGYARDYRVIPKTLINSKLMSSTWEPAIVLESNKAENKIKISFLNWTSDYDEWIDTVKENFRIAQYGSKRNDRYSTRYPTGPDSYGSNAYNLFVDTTGFKEYVNNQRKGKKGKAAPMRKRAIKKKAKKDYSSDEDSTDLSLSESD